jgi:hypothetical protein
MISLGNEFGNFVVVSRRIIQIHRIKCTDQFVLRQGAIVIDIMSTSQSQNNSEEKTNSNGKTKKQK